MKRQENSQKKWRANEMKTMTTHSHIHENRKPHLFYDDCRWFLPLQKKERVQGYFMHWTGTFSAFFAVLLIVFLLLLRLKLIYVAISPIANDSNKKYKIANAHNVQIVCGHSGDLFSMKIISFDVSNIIEPIKIECSILCVDIWAWIEFHFDAMKKCNITFSWDRRIHFSTKL